MYGYNTKYFSKSFLNSFQKSMNESLSTGNRYGIGVNKPLISEENLGIGGEGDWDKVSDLQLQNRMRQYKRSNIFTGDAPDKEQHPEYLSAKKEMERRQGAKNAPAAPAPKPAAPTSTPTVNNISRTAPNTAPGPVKTQPGAPLPNWMTDPNSNGKGEVGTNYVEIAPGDKRTPQVGSTPKPQAATPPMSVRPTSPLSPDQVTKGVEAASQTPAALRQADKRIEAARAAGTDVNAPSVVPVRPATPGKLEPARKAMNIQPTSMSGPAAETATDQTGGAVSGEWRRSSTLGARPDAGKRASMSAVPQQSLRDNLSQYTRQGLVDRGLGMARAESDANNPALNAPPNPNSKESRARVEANRAKVNASLPKPPAPTLGQKLANIFRDN
jgi:hypothetical protein